MRISGYLAIVAMALLSACSSGPKVGQPGSASTLVAADALPAPTLADTQQAREYHVAPFDTLAVKVYDLPDLSIERVQVGADGRLTYPIAGPMPVAGLTTAEVEALIRNRLQAGYVRDPQVSVRLVETVTQVVTVDGQVNQPGSYPTVGDMTLFKAIAEAKGLKDFAKPQAVVVLRTVNGQKMAALYNLTAIRRGVYADPAIYPNDRIYVDDNVAQRYFRDALTIFSTLSYPLVAIVQNL